MLVDAKSHNQYSNKYSTNNHINMTFQINGTVFKSKIIELLEYSKSWFRLGVFTEQDLYAIIGHLDEEGTVETLEVMNQ